MRPNSATPGPSHSPNTFCMPCAKNVPPTANRRISSPTSVAPFHASGLRVGRVVPASGSPKELPGPGSIDVGRSVMPGGETRRAGYVPDSARHSPGSVPVLHEVQRLFPPRVGTELLGDHLVGTPPRARHAAADVRG